MSDIITWATVHRGGELQAKLLGVYSTQQLSFELTGYEAHRQHEGWVATRDHKRLHKGYLLEGDATACAWHAYQDAQREQIAG